MAQLLIDYLQASGLSNAVAGRWYRGYTTYQAISTYLVLLDLMLLQEMALPYAKSYVSSPILKDMVNVKTEEVDRLGLEIGADDYICKPYSPREVVARVNIIASLLSATGYCAK